MESAPSKIDKRANDKALHILGRDFSREKIMNTLGLEDEDVDKADQERVQRTEEEYPMIKYARGREVVKNKRTTTKALDIQRNFQALTDVDVLGVEPSTRKAMNTLGVDESVIKEVEQENIERMEQQIVRKRKNSGSVDKKHATKALEVLGHDPSKEKVKNTLGLEEEDIEQAEQAKIEQFEEKLEKQRSNSWIDKKKSQKALKILGLDPSKKKLGSTLGLDDEEVELAEQEEYERSEEQIKKRRDSLGYSNKKKIQKALNVLGQDPFSEKKLESKLGVAIDTINNARYSPGRDISQNTTVLFFVLLLFVLGIVYYYFQQTKTKN